jgi:hypothetical protein
VLTDGATGAGGPAKGGETHATRNAPRRSAESFRMPEE